MSRDLADDPEFRAAMLALMFAHAEYYRRCGEILRSVAPPEQPVAVAPPVVGPWRPVMPQPAAPDGRMRFKVGP